MVSQPKPASDKSPYFDIAEKHNVELVFRPFIKVEGLSGKEFRQSKININDFTAVIFTARTAIDNFFRLCKELRINIPDTLKYFCVSEAVALYLQKYIVYRKRKIFFGDTGKLDGLEPFLAKHPNERYLYVVSEAHSSNENEMLDSLDIDYTEAVMYRTVSNDFTEDEPFDYDVLLFFSPVGIESLMKNFPDFNQQEISIGAFGNAASKAVTDAGLRLDFSAPNPETPSMPAALDKYLTEKLS